VLVPLLAVIVFMALYPQLALHRSEGSAKRAVAAAHSALERSQTESLASVAPDTAVAHAAATLGAQK
jgi:hypothetical protein